MWEPRCPAFLAGAAIRDFLKVLHRRHERAQVAIYPVPVQGNEAPGRMIQALEDLAAWGWPEVIVLTRGGGSPEDLWAYNDEDLARAIADCPIPVVSAVGHEVDVSISDLAADLRAPTPSAAAEILVKPLADLTKRVEIDSRDEIGQLAALINAVIQRIHDLIARVQASTLQLNATATQIAAAAGEQNSTMQSFNASRFDIR